MYYTGLDPFTKKPVYIARQLRDRKLQRALMQFFKPENYFEVREALQRAKRTDLIGDGCDSLIPSRPPKEALQKRRDDATNGSPATTSTPLREPGPGRSARTKSSRATGRGRGIGRRGEPDRLAGCRAENGVVR